MAAAKLAVAESQFKVIFPAKWFYCTAVLVPSQTDPVDNYIIMFSYS